MHQLYIAQTMQAITMPMYSIPTESYNTFKVNWTATNQIEQLLPFKYVSLKVVPDQLFKKMDLFRKMDISPEP